MQSGGVLRACRQVDTVPHLLVFTVEASLQELPHLVGPALAAMTVALAFGWMTAATTAGAALVLPLAGSLLDRAGPAAAAGAAALVAVPDTVLATSVNHEESELVTGEAR